MWGAYGVEAVLLVLRILWMCGSAVEAIGAVLMLGIIRWALVCLSLLTLAACNNTPVTLTQTSTPRATSTPTSHLLETRLAQLDVQIGTFETVLPQLLVTAQALGTRCAAPTATLTPAPTATLSPTPSPLCQECPSGACPQSYMCKYCPGLGDRCVRKSSPNADCQRCLHMARGAPILRGKATWYGEAVHIDEPMRNREIFDANAFNCAVDDARWDELAGAQLLVYTESTCIVCKVTDTGYLAEWGVVIDLTPAAFEALGLPLSQGVVDVWVWVMEGG